MPAEFYAFGELLWDCLPSGRYAGGAPFNVAAHLAQIGPASGLISTIGQDSLGDELLAVAREKDVNTEFVSRAPAGLPTGTALATLDECGHANYELAQPVAWDAIDVSPATLDAVANARAFIYGSLAARSLPNLEQLNRLLEVKGPLKFFDVNLRPPFCDPATVLELAKRADVLKLNEQELRQLATWLSKPEEKPAQTAEDAVSARGCEIVAQATNLRRICLTRGENGAAFWEDGQLTTACAPRVEVRDTIGAGDAFMAALVIGLTSATEPRKILQDACRLGAFVASREGATPRLSHEILAPLQAH